MYLWETKQEEEKFICHSWLPRFPSIVGWLHGLYACGKAGTSWWEGWPSHKNGSGPGCDLQSHISRNLLPPPGVPPPSSPVSYELMKVRLSRSEHPNTTVLRSMSSIHKSFKEHFFKCAPWFLNSRVFLCSLCLVSLGHKTHSFRFLLLKMHCDLCYGSTDAWLW